MVLATALLFDGGEASLGLPAELQSVLALPDHLRVPFVLRVLERWTWSECARVLGQCPEDLRFAVAQAAMQLARLPRLGEDPVPLVEVAANPPES